MRADSIWDIRMSKRRFLTIICGAIVFAHLPKRTYASDQSLRVRALTKTALYRDHRWAG
jgi:hypothetical protein